MAECYAALKRNEALTHATARMNLEDVRASEMRQLYKDRFYTFPFTQSTGGVTSTGTGGRVVAARARGHAGWGWMAMVVVQH